ncbi:hypothetical protein L1049_008050 [Liquidambar formosana]|uniref:Uncharacterized protein n=1 Tax=Liquidambar formosana TaxID=63359 RepID=A0AAP0S5H2_LIQFO
MALSPLTPPSSMVPDAPKKDVLLFSDDRNYQLHGVIMMLIILLLFTFFLLFLIFLLCIKRSQTPPQPVEAELGLPMSFPIPMLKSQINERPGSLHQKYPC